MENIPLTEKQQQQLLGLLGRGFVLIRDLGWSGKSVQAADLADTLHSLPYDVFHHSFSWDRVERNVETYYKKYPPDTRGDYFDLLALLEKIRLEDFDE